MKLRSGEQVIREAHENDRGTRTEAIKAVTGRIL
jgi:hypothetical protein